MKREASGVMRNIDLLSPSYFPALVTSVMVIASILIFTSSAPEGPWQIRRNPTSRY
jgi:hypothetical protein